MTRRTKAIIMLALSIVMVLACMVLTSVLGWWWLIPTFVWVVSAYCWARLLDKMADEAYIRQVIADIQREGWPWED